ncbi:MAG: MCP four helix bundle domain-containing protein, partial [Asticcacaulis sp.]
MLSNITVRARVIGAFAVVLMAITGLGIFSILRLGAVNAQARDVSENWLPAANYLGDLTQDFELYRSRQGQILLLSGDKQGAMLGKLSGTGKQLETDLANYEATVDSAEERVLADAIHNSLNDYMAQKDPYLDKVQSGDVAGATAVYFDVMQPLTDKLRNAIHADREYQVVQGRKAAALGEKLGRDATTMIVATLIAAALICFAIGLVMIRTISVPIRRMSDIMRIL